MCVYIHDGKVCMLGTNTHLNNPHLTFTLFVIINTRNLRTIYPSLHSFAYISLVPAPTTVFSLRLYYKLRFFTLRSSVQMVKIKNRRKKNEYTCNPFLIVNEQKYFKLKTVHNFFYLLIQTVNHGGSLTNVTSLEYLV